MNSFFVVIICALMAEYIISLSASMLNLKALKPEPPASVDDIYEPEEYRKSQEYARDTTRFGVVTNTFQLALLLAVWLAGGFNLLDQTLRSWNYPSIINGLMFIGSLGIGYMLITLPLGIYSTFIIEERFGFNKTTPGTFVEDRVKAILLAVVVGGALLTAVLALFEYAGSLAWLYCWGSITVVSIVLQFIAPTWIMPMFNKFTSMESGELRDRIYSYASSVDFKIDNILVMDGSRRSSKANAFFTGFGSRKRIALFDTLIEKHTVSELIAILAHEIGHYKKNHILQNMVFGIIHTGVLFFMLSFLLDTQGMYDAFFMEAQSIYAGLLFFGLLYTPVNLGLSVVLHWVSRQHEFDADLWAVGTVDEPLSLVSGLKKLAADNLSNLSPHPLLVLLDYTHPPLVERINAIKEQAAHKYRT